MGSALCDLRTARVGHPSSPPSLRTDQARLGRRTPRVYSCPGKINGATVHSISQQLEAMQAFRFQREDGSTSFIAKAVSAAGALLMILLVWLSADPSAHAYFHHDAGREDHHCAVTDFARGEAYYLAPVALIPPAETSFKRIHFEVVVLRPQPAAYLLLPICGPPLSGLNT